jgi:hypothetical protein
VPWTNSSLTGTFIFNDKQNEEANSASKPDTATPAVGGVDPLAVELAFWQAAKDAGTRQAYKAYLTKYPKGNFAPLVGILFKEIEGEVAAVETQRAELKAAKKEQTDAEKAKRKAEAKEKAIRQAAVEKQADERGQLTKERDVLAQRLKAMEKTAKMRAEAKKEEEQKLAALQPRDQQLNTETLATPLLDQRTMVLVLQNELRRVGCDPGKVDGKWGGKGRAALGKFNIYTKLKLPTDTPTMEALETVKGTKQRVCPLVCGVRFNKKGGQCVKKTCRSGQWLNTRGQCVRATVKRKKKTGTSKKRVSSNSTNKKSSTGGSTGISIVGGGIGLSF